MMSRYIIILLICIYLLMHKVKSFHKLPSNIHFLCHITEEKSKMEIKAQGERSDKTVKYVDVKNEIEEKMPHFQEKQE